MFPNLEQSSCAFDHCVYFENSAQGFLEGRIALCQTTFVQFVMKLVLKLVTLSFCIACTPKNICLALLGAERSDSQTCTGMVKIRQCFHYELGGRV